MIIIFLGVISLHPSVEQNSSSFSFENRPRIICKPLKPSIMDQIQNRMYVYNKSFKGLLYTSMINENCIIAVSL